MVEGQISYCANAHSIVPNINELVQSVRNSGASVIWVRNVTNAEAFQTWSNHYGRNEIRDHRRPETRARRGQRRLQTVA